MFIVIAVSRLTFPFDVEWMEGGMVEHVFRILNSQPIYTAPSLEFIPYIYTPLYFYLSSWVSELTGIGFFPLRLVSFISTLSILLFTFLIVKNETNNKPVSIISAGLFAACFEISGFWFDLARVDSLFLALFVISFYLLISFNNKSSLIFSGIFAALSFLTKQTAFIILVPLVLYIIYDKRWNCLYYIIPLITISSGISLYMNYISDGWYYHWLVEIPAGHQWIYYKIVSFWIIDIFKPLALSFFIGISFLYIIFSGNKRRFILYTALFVGLFLCAWSSRIHLGGYDNVLMPAFFGITLLFGLGLNELLSVISGNKKSQNQYLKLFLFLAVIAQFFILFYNPFTQIPKEQDWAYGNKLIKEMRQTKGEVYIPDHQYIARYAGKTSYAHFYVLIDFFESKSNLKDSLKSEFKNLFKNESFSMIISDSYTGLDEYSKYYRFESNLFPDDKYFKCKTGGRKTRPEFIFKPK
jgi:hypothetical protein